MVIQLSCHHVRYSDVANQLASTSDISVIFELNTEAREAVILISSSSRTAKVGHRRYSDSVGELSLLIMRTFEPVQQLHRHMKIFGGNLKA